MEKKAIYLTLKANEKFFVNGAVLRSDRKVTLELLNDANFLLENHVIQADETNTPLKQLYFAGQLILMDSLAAGQASEVFCQLLQELRQVLKDPQILEGLAKCATLYEQGRLFHILKLLRGLFSHEAKIMERLASTFNAVAE
ncbi:flagellar biosynthesis repressor FlbT [Bartonella sp. DGB2]|uniref:flagellar biosynthesis repressor FlbT n=1 Tax=Bartonella sp. DGB2 TaxID=3388426 RepID=UPI00398FBF8F